MIESAKPVLLALAIGGSLLAIILRVRAFAEQGRAHERRKLTAVATIAYGAGVLCGSAYVVLVFLGRPDAATGLGAALAVAVLGWWRIAVGVRRYRSGGS